MTTEEGSNKNRKRSRLMMSILTVLMSCRPSHCLLRPCEAFALGDRAFRALKEKKEDEIGDGI
jgi:hypothetical protein